MALPSKGDLGIGYLAGTGISLIVNLIFWFIIGPDPDFSAYVGTITGIILSLTLIYLAFWLTQSELDEDHIWSVARWGAIGLAIPTIPILGIVVFGFQTGIGVESSVLVNIAAASAVIGALFGAVTELEAEHIRVLRLNQRNVVLNRVLRHDIRNDAGLLLILAERLEVEFEEAGAEFAEPIRRKTQEIIEVSERAKRVEQLDDETDNQPVDVVAIVADKVEAVQSTRLGVHIDADLPDEAFVLADELLRTVIDNLVENAIEHNDENPRIKITVNVLSATDQIEIAIADNGPGMPAEIARILTEEQTRLYHRNPDIGLGLWLVWWFVDTYNGTLKISENDPRGTIVHIMLPRATT